MKVKLKQRGFLWEKKVCVDAVIDDLLLKQDPVAVDKGTVFVYYKGATGKGIVEFSVGELQKLVRSLGPGFDLFQKATKTERINKRFK